MQNVERRYRRPNWIILLRIQNHKSERFIWTSIQTSFQWPVYEYPVFAVDHDPVYKGIHRNQNKCGHKNRIIIDQSDYSGPEL